jgi:hypothetical protein
MSSRRTTNCIIFSIIYTSTENYNLFLGLEQTLTMTLPIIHVQFPQQDYETMKNRVYIIINSFIEK